MSPTYKSFGYSDVGLRKNNEDMWAELAENNFFVLADGMGGHVAGEVASREAVLHFCDAVDKYFRSKAPPTLPSAKRYLGETFISANSWLRRLSRDHPDLSGMGTTLCCLLFLQNTVIIGHVGDSRIYRFHRRHEDAASKGALENLCRLTTDHCLDPTSGNCKHLLTRAIGISPAIVPELLELPTSIHDVYLLCSDGLHDVLSDKEIGTIVNQPLPLKEIALQLVTAAKQKGSRDNITVLLVEVEHGEWWNR